MSWAASFNAAIDKNIRVLVLGSMPGIASLEAEEYYAHPRNCFWPIIEVLFGIDRRDDYAVRLEQLNQQGVGLWDVYHNCYRPGSLDAAIDKKTAELNDFKKLFLDCRQLRAIALNGKEAQQTFKKHVLKDLPASIELLDMPSTSPAFAAMSFKDKLEKWSIIKSYV